jgi:hypothetical protein
MWSSVRESEPNRVHVHKLHRWSAGGKRTGLALEKLSIRAFLLMQAKRCFKNRAM